MKKVIFVCMISLVVSFSYAQNTKQDSCSQYESQKTLNLSADQIAKIKKQNREKGAKFRAIGQSNLPGYEKGKKKRALALEHKSAIRGILTENQIAIWENHYGNMDQDDSLRDIIKDDYDIRLKQLEKKYEQDKKSIKKSSLKKEEKKEKLKILKKKYKKEKGLLKQERDEAERSGVFIK